jgi:hypothetical protein
MDWRPKDWSWAPRFFAVPKRLALNTAQLLARGGTKVRSIERSDLRRVWAQAKSYASSYYFTALILIALVLALPWYNLLTTVRGSLSELLATAPAVGKDGVPDVRGHYYAIGILIAALAAIVTAPLALLKAYINERQTTAAEEGLITDRFTRAVEQLGIEKTVKHRERLIKYRVPDDRKGARLHQATEIKGQSFALPEGAMARQTGAWESVEETVPNLEVRLGAIYALERIAQDSERDHIPIMETSAPTSARTPPAARPRTTIWASGSRCPTALLPKSAKHIWNGASSGLAHIVLTLWLGTGHTRSTRLATTYRRL